MSVETEMPPFEGVLPGSAGGRAASDADARGDLAADWTARLGRSMAPVWRRFGAMHKAVYLASGGRVGSELLTIPMLLLSTRGRRSGLVRTMPLAYLPDPEDPQTCVTVASNGGSSKPPAWWLNLSAEPRATVQAGTEHFWVEAEEAPAERRADLWRALRASIPPYRVYEKIEREIPIVLLRRIPAEEPVFFTESAGA
ncbi:MAG: nitroreductase/quinone reductase family protein [Myxococcota bacterium]